MYVKPVSVEGVCQYDPDTHRWLLDISAIKKAMPELSDEEAASKQESYSRHVYQWFQFMLVNTANWPFVEFVLSCTEQGKQDMLQALNAQMSADRTSNIDSLGEQSPIDVTSGAEINQASLMSASIATFAKMILRNASIDIGGAPLLLSKYYSFGIFLPSDRYAVWGY